MNHPLLSSGRRTDCIRCLVCCGPNQQFKHCRSGSAFVPCLVDEQRNLIVIQQNPPIPQDRRREVVLVPMAEIFAEPSADSLKRR